MIHSYIKQITNKSQTNHKQITNKSQTNHKQITNKMPSRKEEREFWAYTHEYTMNVREKETRASALLLENDPIEEEERHQQNGHHDDVYNKHSNKTTRTRTRTTTKYKLVPLVLVKK